MTSSSALPPPSLASAHADGRLAVATLAQLRTPEGVTLPRSVTPVVALAPEPPARRPRHAPGAPPPAPSSGVTPMPEWEGGEHTYLGNNVVLHFDGASGPAKNFPLDLDNGLALTYGQVIALGGDFYGLPDEPISDDPSPPSRFKRAYATLAVAPAAVPEVPKILAVMQIEIDAVNRAIKEGRQPSSAYAALGDDLSAQWNVITGGGSILSDMLPPGRYLNLAATNWDHFGQHAITCYTTGHGVAIAAAIAARGAPDPATRRTLLERAYAMNAFADHYLTDIFSSGHMRTPRKELYETVSPSAVGSLLSRFMHDEDCAYGLQVTNARGNAWKAYGDKRLLDTVNQANLVIVQAAAQASADEVWAAYQSGTAPASYQALTYVANLAQFDNPSDPTNPSALFIASGNSTDRRTNPADRFDYSWTNDWWGWSTYTLLSNLPEFEDMGDSEIPVTVDAGILQLWANGSKLGFIQYGLKGNSFGTVWSSTDMGQGPGAVQFLAADFRDQGQTDVLQLWNNSNKLGMILYTPLSPGPGYQTAWTNTNVGQGPGAVQWLVVDRNGDGQKQVVQCWANGSKLGMILYAPDPGGAGFVTSWTNPDMGQGPGAVKWLVVDRNGDGKSEILQLWNNNGKLAMILYSPDPSGPGYVTSWTNTDMGQGPGAVAFLPVDYAGDGKTHVLQCWANGGSLGMILYSPDPNGVGYITSWYNPNLGEGPGAVQWIPVTLGDSSRTHVLQCWANGSKLGMVLYSPVCDDPSHPSYYVRWQSGDLGEGPGAVAWLPAVVGPDDSTNVIQLWANGSKLGMIVYEPSDVTSGYKVAGQIDDLGQGPGAVAFFTADVTNPGDGED